MDDAFRTYTLTIAFKAIIKDLLFGMALAHYPLKLLDTGLLIMLGSRCVASISMAIAIIIS
jgi:hypothetical protein